MNKLNWISTLFILIISSPVFSFETKDPLLAEIESKVKESLGQNDVLITINQIDKSVIEKEKQKNPQANIQIQDVHFSDDQKNFFMNLSLDNAKTMILKGTIEIQVMVPVLNRLVMPQEIIKQEDIQWKKVQSSRVRGTWLMDSSRIVGNIVRYRPIQPNDPININDIQAPILVKRGAIVNIIYKTPNMYLSTKGIAKKDGSKGEMIEFTSLNANGSANPKDIKTIYAQVVGESQATVILSDGNAS